jgi:hypothetical protein
LGLGPAIIASQVVAGIGVMLVPLARGASPLSAGLLVGQQLITDPAFTIYEIHAVSLRQSLASDRIQGRVNATMEFVGLGATMVGALLAGGLGSWLGLRATLFVGAGAPILAGLALWASPVRRLLRLTPAA